VNTLLIQFAVAVAVFVAGGAAGIRWHAGQDAIAAQKAAEEREIDGHAVDEVIAEAGQKHAAEVAKLVRQLGDARVQIRSLTTGRDCLGPDAVGVLNAAGVPAAGQAPASQPASAPRAAATDQDVGDALAICRGEYAKVTGQLNAILDIEDARSGPIAAANQIVGGGPPVAGEGRRAGSSSLAIQPATAPPRSSLQAERRTQHPEAL